MPWRFHLRASLIDVPRHALLAVVLGGDRADDLLREPAAVRLPLELLVSQAEIHGTPPKFGSQWLTDQSTNDRIAVAAKPPYPAVIVGRPVLRPLAVPPGSDPARGGWLARGSTRRARRGQRAADRREVHRRRGGRGARLPGLRHQEHHSRRRGDAAADVAGAVSAVFPSTSPTNRPHAVVIVDRRDWQAAVAASVLMASPLGAPTLLSDAASCPRSRATRSCA